MEEPTAQNGMPGEAAPGGPAKAGAAMIAVGAGTSLAERLDQHPSMQIVRAPEYRGASLEVEAAEYTLSVLTEKERAEVLREPPMTVGEIGALLAQESTSRLSAEGAFALPADLVRQIDMRVREPIFVTDAGEVYTEKQLREKYPFDVMGVEPLEAFAQQELGIFPGAADECRDLGETGEFLSAPDQVARCARGSREVKHPLARAVKTKVFLAREGWQDFIALHRQVRGIARFGRAAAGRAQVTGRMNVLALMLGGQVSAPRAIAGNKTSAHE